MNRTTRFRCFVVMMIWLGWITDASAQTVAFEVASIRPSSERVKFERNGKAEFVAGTLTMRDVSVGSCIQLAYGTTLGLVTGPAAIRDVHYDITAKTDPKASFDDMKLMLQALLKDRFGLKFHTEQKEMRVYSLKVSNGGLKMHPSADSSAPQHQNSSMGMVARSMTIRELADYLSQQQESPLTDDTGLKTRYDFTIDFTPYIDRTQTDIRPDPAAVLKSALKDELGLDMSQTKKIVELIVVDHVDAPSND